MCRPTFLFEESVLENSTGYRLKWTQHYRTQYAKDSSNYIRFDSILGLAPSGTRGLPDRSEAGGRLFRGISLFNMTPLLSLLSQIGTDNLRSNHNHS